MDVGPAGGVAHLLRFDAGPRGARDDLARLRLDVAEADLLVLLRKCQVVVDAPRDLRERLPGLHRHFAVGLGREHQDHFRRVDVGLDARHAVRDPGFGHRPVEPGQRLDFVLGVPGDALAAVADLRHQRTERRELAIGVRIVALDHRQVGCRLAGNQVALRTLPVAHADRLGEFARRVVHERRHHQLLLDAQVPDADLRELPRDALVDLPVGTRLPHRIHRGRQRMDERMHVGGVEVVLLVPGRGGQHHVGVEARGGHAEVQGHQQVELALGRLLVPHHLLGPRVVDAEVAALHAMTGAEQVLEEVLVSLARAAEQVRAPHEQVARESSPDRPGPRTPCAASLP